MTDIIQQESHNYHPESPLPFPQGVTDKTVSEVGALLQADKPLYYAIGKTISNEADELHRMNDARYYTRGGIVGMLTEKTESIALAREVFADEVWGYRAVSNVLEDAFIIVSTNGEPENHPDFNEDRHSTDVTHTQHVLEVMRNGEAGIATLLDEKLGEVKDPNSAFNHGRVTSFSRPYIMGGLMAGIKRYHELLDYFTRNH